MRITIIHCSFIYTGGGERIILEQIKYLRALGYDVECYAPIYDPRQCFPDIIQQYDIKTFLPQLPSWFPLRHALVLLCTCLFIPLFFFKFFKTDVFLGENQPGAWLAFVLSRILRKPYVVFLNHPNRILYPRPHEDWASVTDFRFLSVLFAYIRPVIAFLDTKSILGATRRLVNGYFIGREIEDIYRCSWTACPSGSPVIGDYLERSISPVKNHLYTYSTSPYFKYGVSHKFSFRYDPGFIGMECDYLNDFLGKRLHSQFALSTHHYGYTSHRDRSHINDFNLDNTYILYTGRHQPWKRIDWLIQIFAEVRAHSSTDVYLVIRGPFTPHTNVLRRLACELSIADRVVFIDENGQNDLFKLYKNAAIYAFPSEREDFGIVVIEAMGQGLPVVAWNVGGPTDSVVNEETGYLVEPYNRDAYAQKLVYLLENEHVREIMGRAGIARVKKLFSWERHIAVLEKALMRVG
jgi:glycosyltransferase involved in cell wall biosynthesis